jgi:hypothetical protein
MDEGEVLFPPYSKFKVVKVTAPGAQKQATLTKEEKAAVAFHAKHKQAYKDAEAAYLGDIFGPGNQTFEQFFKLESGLKKLPAGWEEKLELGESIQAKQSQD